MYALFWQHTQIEAWFCWHIAMCKQNHALFWIVEFKFEQKPNAAFIFVSLLSHDDQGYRENMQNSLKSESQIWEDGSGNEFKTKIHKKNTKNWYTIDALGAIFAIFTILDSFAILLQYSCTTFTILLQYVCNTFVILLQYFCNTFAILLQYFCNTFTIL